MSIKLSSQTIEKHIAVKERTFHIKVNAPSLLDEKDYHLTIEREIATFINGKIDNTTIEDIPATPEDGGFKSELGITVGDINKIDGEITLCDGDTVKVKNIPEIVRRVCDIISQNEKEKRRLKAAQG